MDLHTFHPVMSRREKGSDQSLLTGDYPRPTGAVRQCKTGITDLTNRTLPQRQKPEPIAPEARSDLLGLPAYFASTPPYSDYLTTAPSKTEGGKGPAIYVNSDIPTINPGASKIFYEVAHVHPSENSLHVYTSPRDARLIVERGWGRRFPIEWLAPPTWIMVYSPRDEEEVKVVKRIVRAACCFAVGKHLGGDEV